MADFLDKWMREIELMLKHAEKGINWKRVLEDHRAMVGFLQHERLIHLMVTLAVAGMFLVTVLFSLVFKSVILGIARFRRQCASHFPRVRRRRKAKQR